MAKRYTEKPKRLTPNEKEKRLHELTVNRSFENTDKYDIEIESLTADLDYFNFGIKKTK